MAEPREENMEKPTPNLKGELSDAEIGKVVGGRDTQVTEPTEPTLTTTPT